MPAVFCVVIVLYRHDAQDFLVMVAALDGWAASCFQQAMRQMKETKQFQVFVNKIIRGKGIKDIKNICFNPNDSVSINGFNPRGKAPYFLINIAGRKELHKAHKALTKTNYYDNMDVKYKSFLKIGGK